MKKIKSYTSIWAVEKVIYAINDFQLPFPVTFNQMAWFVLSFPIYFETKNSVRVKVIVKYLDDVEKVTHDFQYNLLLSKGENWKITNCE